MYDLISIGSLTVDLYFQSDSLTVQNGRFELAYGGKYYTDHFHESLGGGATNVAIGLRRLGVNVTLKATIGDNGFRSMVEERLQKERVSYIYSNFEKDYQSISCILLSPKGEKTVINYRTPHQKIFTSEREKKSLLRSRAIFLANLTDVSFTNKVDALRYFKSNGKFVFTNMGSEDCRRSREQIQEMLKHTDILIVNVHEFADLVNRPVEKLNFNENLYSLLKVPELKALIVTQDKKGSYGYTSESFNYQAAVAPPRIVDVTGAGDAYSAGFIASYLEHENIARAMEAGSRYAAKILGKIGAN